MNTPDGAPVQRGRVVSGQEKKKRYPCRVVGGEVAEDLFERGVCLPSGTAMSNGELDRVTEVIKGCRE